MCSLDLGLITELTRCYIGYRPTVLGTSRPTCIQQLEQKPRSQVGDSLSPSIYTPTAQSVELPSIIKTHAIVD